MTSTYLKTLVSSVAVAALSYSTAGAITGEQQLETWKADVEKARKIMHAEFNLHAAGKLQKKAFVNGGVEWAQRYTNSWSGWVYTDWDVAKRLHQRTINTLKKSIGKVRNKELLSEETMIQHRKMMSQFHDQNAKTRKLLNARIKINVHQGLELDQYNHYHNAYLAAKLAGAKRSAALLKIKADYHYKRSQQWSKHGAAASNLIRMIGYGKVTDPDSFKQNYDHSLSLAKSGELPAGTNTTAAN